MATVKPELSIPTLLQNKKKNNNNNNNNIHIGSGAFFGFVSRSIGDDPFCIYPG